ncbi:hydroxyacylglutathione hydrolase, putative [Pseudooceanicola batsensis HTCC2597]|uniref:Hydroxyacylglutathione hydrolase n=1 Tax=Pseudooceanicola batsensis (strain ATCC BAA-863 / DSM 15984 / KCTC 12145 / HTCC2597) TaxID=252305 RepID=A3TUW1_PSEBH|nr:hydroxyacylglutathione hydrolase [Pseudooceanicola batsensis]EAQ04307.1 hydroxyacylglutathione hydrolase, putative [Pseudooceanicola batsensis HTCC2597]
MPLDIVTVPCRSDNYAYLVKGPDGVCIIDAPEAAPLIAAAKDRGWTPDVLMITHHHGDHTAGTDDLKAAFPGLRVMGPKAEEDKLPPLDMALSEGMNGGEGEAYTVPLDVPGHTLGHMAFHFPEAGVIFTADSLMSWGCGRVFEGTPEMMHATLQKLAALLPETLIYSGHEYTLANMKFALSIEPDNPDLLARADKVQAQRDAGEATVPVTLAEELKTNPFLRCDTPQVAKAVGMEGAAPVDIFAEVRKRKDNF